MKPSARNRRCAFREEDALQTESLSPAATATPTRNDMEAAEFNPFGLVRKNQDGLPFVVQGLADEHSRYCIRNPHDQGESSAFDADRPGLQLTLPPPRPAAEFDRVHGPGAVHIRGPSLSGRFERAGRSRIREGNFGEEESQEQPSIVFTSATAVAVAPEETVSAGTSAASPKVAGSDACCSVACPCDANMSCSVLTPCCEIRAPSCNYRRRRMHSNVLLAVFVIAVVATVLGVIYGRPNPGDTNTSEMGRDEFDQAKTAETASLQPNVTNPPSSELATTAESASLRPSITNPPTSDLATAMATPSLQPKETTPPPSVTSSIAPSTVIQSTLSGTLSSPHSDPMTTQPAIERQGIEVCENGKLFAADKTSDAWFGGSMAMSGDTAVVGSELDSVNGNFSGSAYVFVHSSNSAWSQQAKLVPRDGAPHDFFGWDVDVSHDTAIIAARGHGEERGGAYIFGRDGSTWTQQAKLLGDDDMESKGFGESAAIGGEGDTAVVGCVDENDSSESGGSAYVFVKTDDSMSWTQQVKLVSGDGQTDKMFGSCVEIDEDSTIVVTSPAEDESDSNSGSAFVFVRTAGSTWTEQAKLLPSDSFSGREFGRSVAIDNGRVIIGAPGNERKGQSVGSAYVFVRSLSTWTQQAQLLPDDEEENVSFGAYVSLSGGVAAVGAHQDSTNGENCGSAYLFSFTGSAWTQQAKLVPGDGKPEDFYGLSLVVEDETIIIGSPHHDGDSQGESVHGAGSAYAFSLC